MFQNSVTNAANVATTIDGIEHLTGSNFPVWKDKINMVLGVLDLDYALRFDEPVAPTSEEENYAEKKKIYDTNSERWERSNRISLMIMRSTISVGIREAILESEKAKKYLASVEEHFKGSSKVYASTLIQKLLNTKYNGTGIREHIMMMTDMSAKLKAMKMEISDGFLVHFIMTSLPPEYNAFKIAYNTRNDNWSMSDLIAMCVQEEERIKAEPKEYVHHVGLSKRKFQGDFSKSKKKLQFSPQKGQGQVQKGSKPYASSAGPSSVPQKPAYDNCLFCRNPGHFQRDCPGFLKWLHKKGNDEITFIDESLYVDYSLSTWWIDSGATVHVTNSLQGFHTVIRLGKGERSLRVANGKEAEVEAVGVLHLELDNGNILRLNNVVFVPSMRRNLISVSLLDDDGYECLFGNRKCVIILNSDYVGLAVRRDKLYLLSIHESSESINVCDLNKRKKGDETSSKLWHCHLSHISRGRMKCLIKEDILHPLDFTNSYNCFYCIKGKYVKQIKKGATRST